MEENDDENATSTTPPILLGTISAVDDEEETCVATYKIRPFNVSTEDAKYETPSFANVHQLDVGDRVELCNHPAFPEWALTEEELRRSLAVLGRDRASGSHCWYIAQVSTQAILGSLLSILLFCVLFKGVGIILCGFYIKFVSKMLDKLSKQGLVEGGKKVSTNEVDNAWTSCSKKILFVFVRPLYHSFRIAMILLNHPIERRYLDRYRRFGKSVLGRVTKEKNDLQQAVYDLLSVDAAETQSYEVWFSTPLNHETQKRKYQRGDSIEILHIPKIESSGYPKELIEKRRAELEWRLYDAVLEITAEAIQFVLFCILTALTSTLLGLLPVSIFILTDKESRQEGVRTGELFHLYVIMFLFIWKAFMTTFLVLGFIGALMATFLPTNGKIMTSKQTSAFEEVSALVDQGSVELPISSKL